MGQPKGSDRFLWKRALLASVIGGFVYGLGASAKGMSMEPGLGVVDAVQSTLPYVFLLGSVIFFVLQLVSWDYERKRPPNKDDEDRAREERYRWRQ